MAKERFRHAAFAAILAILVGVTTILRPLDIAAWALQSKMFTHQASGEIVFVELENDASAKTMVGNGDLARSLEYLDKAGANRIFIDIPLKRQGDVGSDLQLRTVLEGLGDRVTLTEAVRSDFPDSQSVDSNDQYYSSGRNVVSNDYQTDFIGYVWELPAANYRDRRKMVSLAYALASDASEDAAVCPDYTIEMASVPTINSNQIRINDLSSERRFAGKTVVLGVRDNSARMVRAPEEGMIASSMIHIIGAETLIRGAGQNPHWLVLLSVFGLGLVLGSLYFGDKHWRRRFYVLWSLTLVACFVVTANLGIRTTFSDATAAAVIYAAFRLVANYRRRYLYRDSRSKLPNFAALQRDLDDNHDSDACAIGVAKIARLDAVFATLSLTEQARYLRQIGARLTLGDTGETIYYDGGKYFGFFLRNMSAEDLQEHLSGLRAVVSQSITIAERPIDVSMTIGADNCIGKSVASRLSSAIAAADQAREAYQPVFVISDLEADSDTWDHSLQARLETALSEDRISIKLQPQVDFESGLIIGAEALARWVDEERGEISPERFIGQCERVGRLDDLTKRILLKSLRAANSLRGDGHNPMISVNASAIQFLDDRMTVMIGESLSRTSIDPAKLTIEVTETARIENFAIARDVFEEIKRSGVRFSMDDFGVASANLDVMLELPFDEIKIDRQFVSRMTTSRRARAIVANVIRLAKDAGVVVVAEGIEDRESYELLRAMGCDIGQGYLIARPLPLDGFKEILDLQRDMPIFSQKLG
ncbi:GGDEF domain-containing phosphodiesterase [Allopontixanthobacter sp.]|uniref:GGDEF domain-containing phosphodiesterase n=1 Tax=Allopontixanthobacter sp. TaxID=2906452 RepID=UPI002AB9E9F1|nr:GGDEF domain-containing phosphodiesterase [Allopontixanthobacter sp.]MDZ4307055.1 GGDEF domain-containing phosphodiesterase [Allopontixanthobacter sp.]